MRYLADENFNARIVRGVLLRIPELKIEFAQNVGLSGMGDEQVLEWAASVGAVLLTHDADTVPHFAFERIRKGEKMPGVIVIASRAAIGPAIDDLVLLATCSFPGEWEGHVIYLPL